METRQYIGLSSTPFKQRLANHTASFNNKSKANSTELSKYVWQLKQNQEKYLLQWSIVQRSASYNPITKKCNLCLSEKFHIMAAPQNTCLNKRSELISSCRHKQKYKLCDFGIQWIFSEAFFIVYYARGFKVCQSDDCLQARGMKLSVTVYM